MLVLVAVPLLMMMVLSFLDIRGVDWKTASFSLQNFSEAFNPVYIQAFFRSLRLAGITTIISLLLGYPVSYIIWKSTIRHKYLILLILILPMWTNMLLRIQSLNRILLPEGFLKNVFGISSNLSGTEFSVILAMVMMYLPFMIFPIYTVLEKIEPSLLEASQDLGASKIKTFQKVTLPLSFKGISSGIIMVFLPCAMGFAIPEIMSGGNMLLIGTIIEQKFKQGTGYNVGSLISLVVIVFVFLALWVIGKVDEEGETLL
jgi:spermidine/putrescine transport system permease protein